MKTVVVTGAAGVLCSGFSRFLAKEGYRLALLDRDMKANLALEAELTASGAVAKAYEIDVLKKETLEAVHERVLQDLGPCDILINGAGGNNPMATVAHETFRPGDEETAAEEALTFFNLPMEKFGFVFNLNILGVLLPTQVFSRDMIGRKGCSIINMTSMCSFRPLTKVVAYSSAKAALSNFTQWLAVYFGGQGIRVNAISPGFFVGNQNRSLLFNPDGTPTERTAKILRATPMGRFGEAVELQGTLKWLIDETQSGFVTGVIVPVDGGFSAYSGV